MRSSDRQIEARSQSHRVSSESSRYDRLENLKQYFLENLVEDPIDGTPFDTDVLRSIETLQNQYNRTDVCTCGEEAEAFMTLTSPQHDQTCAKYGKV